MNKKQGLKILRGAAIAAAGAALTYAAQALNGANFGAYTPVVTAVLAILVNVVRQYGQGSK